MKKILPIVIGLLLVVGGYLAYDAVLGETEEASSPIVAEQVEEPVVEETFNGATLFSLDQTQSTASFALDEDLFGERVTVVGVTDQVAAEISFDVANPSAAQVGVITINARTLVTDNDRRNRAIGNRILRTTEFEFIRFEPTALNGLPDSVAMGETVEFDIVGDLTVMDVTLPVTFKTAVIPTSDTELSGTATATILYQDFGIPIPTAPVIANVEEELELMLEFVAVAQ